MTTRSGYSLFEVLVAFTIMSLVLAALLPGQVRLLNRAVSQEERLVAQDFALSKIAEIGVSVPISQVEATAQYREWTVSTTKVPTQINGYKVFEIIVQIRGRRGDILAEVETLMAAQ